MLEVDKDKIMKVHVATICTLLLVNGCLSQLPLSKTAQSDDCGVVDENPNDIRTKAPWVAAIFARPSSKHPFEYRVSGTIISPQTILTIFAGAYGEPINKVGKYFLSPPFNYKVGTGLKSNSLEDGVGSNSQLREVSSIVPFTGLEAENHEYHFFIFHLKTPLDLKTPYVRAACIPILVKFFGSSLLEKVQELRQGGFSVPPLPGGTNPLQVVKVSLGASNYCSNIYVKFYSGSPDSIYCGNNTEVSATEFRCPLHGAAAVVPLINNKWFVIGITALIPPLTQGNDWCNANTVYFYGKLTKAIDWIENNIKCGPTQFACGDGECIKADRVCDKKSDCSGNEDEDPIYCRARRPCIFDGKSHECGVYGECIKPSQVCDGTPDCFDESDESPSTCGGIIPQKTAETSDRINIKGGRGSSTAKCPLLQTSEGVEIRCRHPSTGDRVACNEAGLGTIATLKCQSYYKSVYRLSTTETKCSDDGTWKPHRPFGCEPECGIISNDESTDGLIPFIVEGQATTKAEAFPWHAAMFFKRKDNFDFICGGSLIEKTIMITAAHCVTDQSGQIKGKQSYKVALGTLSSKFTENQKNEHVQIFNIKNIWIPSTYDRRNLQSDIALIELDKPVHFGEYVRPICYFSQSGHGLPNPGDIGKVSGLGFVDDKMVADRLMYAAFPVVSTAECGKALKRIPPLSTFCAGYQNGTAVCQGDSGGGMAFPEQIDTSSARYVLKGIVSHGEVVPGKLCNPNNYAVFTHVDAFADWILQRLEGLVNKK